MSKPFFSIITPTCNSDKYLTECIKSVESQTFTKWEHIFVDYNSSDKTCSIIRRYMKKYPEKVFLYRCKSAGISRAFNQGVNKSRGKIINFLGSDDLLFNNSLSEVYKFMTKNYNSSWIYGNVKIINSLGKIVKLKRYSKFSYTGLRYLFHICHQSVFMKREVFNKFGLFRTDLRYAMDYEFFLRIGNKLPPKKMNYFVCGFRKTYDSVTFGKWNNQMDEKLKISLEYSNLFSKPLVFLFNRVVYLKKYLGFSY